MLGTVGLDVGSLIPSELVHVDVPGSVSHHGFDPGEVRGEAVGGVALVVHGERLRHESYLKCDAIIHLHELLVGAIVRGNVATVAGKQMTNGEFLGANFSANYFPGIVLASSTPRGSAPKQQSRHGGKAAPHKGGGGRT